MDNGDCIEVLYFFLNVVSIQSNMSFSLLKVNHHDHAMTLDCRGYLLVFLMLLEITMYSTCSTCQISLDPFSCLPGKI